MSVLLDAVFVPFAVIALVIAAFLALEVAAALPERPRAPALARPRRIAVVIPAHNEAADVGYAIADVKAQLSSEDRLIVVADNCTDATADAARAAGAEVLLRDDAERRGKGYALQCGVDALREDPPDVVCFFDADCRVEAGAVAALAAAGALRPAQCMNLVTPRKRSSQEAASAFAFLFMNRIRMSGLDRLFGVTRLTGTGMALPWSVAGDAGFAAPDIVEDLKLTIETTSRGAPPRLVPQARINSGLAPPGEAAHAQRARWEHGSLRIARRAPALLWTAARTGNGALAALAADLAIPPLGLFFAALVALVLTTGVGALVGASAAFPIAIAALIVFTAACAVGWAAFGRALLPPAKFAGLAAYLFGKVMIYGRRARDSTRVWTRSARGGEQGR